LKWLRLTAFTLMLLFITMACADTAAHTQSTITRVPQSEFRSFSVESAVPSVPPTPTLTPAPSSGPTQRPKQKPTSVSSRQGTGGTASKVITGEASWGYGFKGHVVTRYPRGTVIRVCGRLGCTGKVLSWGYGPAKRTGRIADLDVSVFENVCGPRSMGVCQIKLEVWK
jgi:hypothetical protein